MKKYKAKSTKRRNWILGILLIILGIGIITLFLRLNRVKMYDDPSTVGNSSANLLNGGFFAENGNTIYFANPYDQNTLYSMNQDLKKIKKLNGDNVSYINAADPYLFYTRRNDKKKHDADALLNLNTTGLYRTNKKGSEQRVLYNGATQGLCLLGNSIYYQHYDKEKGLQLYSVRIDGDNETMLLEESVSSNCIQDNTIYFTGMQNDHYIYSMNTDGTNKQVIYDGNCTSLSLVDNWLYFMDMANDYTLCRIRTDGSELTRLTPQRIATYNTDGSTVYYQVDNGSDNGLYSMELDSGTSHLLQTGNFNYIHLLSNYLFFETYDASAAYVMNLDNEQIEEFKAPSNE